jgi:hypothetical protein
MPRQMLLSRWFALRLTPYEVEGCLGWLDDMLDVFAG